MQSISVVSSLIALLGYLADLDSKVQEESKEKLFFFFFLPTKPYSKDNSTKFTDRKKTCSPE